MKNNFAYILIIFVSFAFSFETIKYFSKTIGDNSIVWIDDFDCEEKDPESKKSNENNEETDFSDDLYLNNKHLNNHQNSNQTLIQFIC